MKTKIILSVILTFLSTQLFAVNLDGVGVSNAPVDVDYIKIAHPNGRGGFSDSLVPASSMGSLFDIINRTSAFKKGGANLILDGLANPHPALGGSLWTSKRQPYLFLNVDPYNTTNNRQTYIYTNVMYYVTNGTLPAILTNGVKVSVMVDVGWDSRTGRSLPSMQTNNGGFLTDAITFPSGLGGLVDIMHTNGMMISLGAYGCTNITPAGADEMICDVDGSDLRPWTNAVGQFPTSHKGTPYVTAIGPDNVSDYVSELTLFGVDEVEVNDFSYNLPTFYEVQNMFGYALLNPSVYNGVTLPATRATYAANPGSITNNVRTSQFYTTFFTNAFPPALRMFATVGSEQSRSFGQYLSANAYRYENDANAFDTNGDLCLRRESRDFSNKKKAYDGAYFLQPFNTTAENIYQFTAAALFSSDISMDINSGLRSGGLSGVLKAYNCWASIWNDPDQNLPKMIIDASTSGSVWTKKLSDGSVAVGCFNNSGTVSTNYTIKWSDLGFMDGQGVVVTNVFGASGGSFVGLYYTNSLTVTVYHSGYSAGLLYKFTPSSVPGGILNGPTNSVAPGNTTTPKAWANFTNSAGGTFKLPLYQ